MKLLPRHSATELSESRLEQFLRRLLRPVIRVLDRHYAPPFQELATRLSQINADIDHLADQIETAGATTARFTATLDLLEDQGRRNRRAIETARKGATELSHRLEASEETTARLTATLNDSEETTARITATLNLLEDQSRHNRRAIETARECTTELSQRLSASEGLSAALDAMKTRLDHHNQALDDCHSETKKTASRLSAAEESIAQKAGPEFVEALSSTQKQVTTHLAELQRDYDEVKRIFRNRDNALQELSKRNESLEARATELAAGLEALRATLESIQDLTLSVPEIRDRVDDIGKFLADAARERTILAECIDQCSTAKDEK